MSDTKKKIYLGEDLVCQTFTDAEEQAKAFDLFGLEQPVVSSNAPASARPVQQGQVCEFDGVDDYIEIGSALNAVLDVNSLYVGATFNYDNVAADGFIVGNGEGGGSSRATLSIKNYISRLSVIVGDNGSQFTSWDTGLALTSGQWHTAKAWLDETILYATLDGTTVSTSLTYNPAIRPTSSWSIGRFGTYSAGLYFGGKISFIEIGDANGGQAQYNLNHASGTTAYDSSGNGNHGTLQNGAAFVVDNTLPPEADKLNLEGFSRRMLFDGVNDFVDLGASFLNVSGAEIRITAKIEVGGNPRVIVSQGGATGGWVVNTDTNNKLRIVIKQNGSTSTYRTILSSVVLSEGQIYDIDVKFSQDTATVIINGVEDASVNIGSPVGVYGDSVSNVFIGARGDNSLWWEGLIFDCNLYLDGVLLSSCNGYGNTDADWTDQSGNGNDGTVNGSPENLLLPRDESDPANDIDGNPLQYSGSVYPRRPEYRNSYAASFDGVDDYISATYLTGSETVTSSEGTSTPSISAGRIDFTAGTCSNLILSDGTRYPLTEGAGDTAYDISGNGNHGTINNASTATEGAGFWVGRIDGEENALNNNNGFTLYENGVNKLRVPYVDGSPLASPTVPAGYTLTSENPAITDGYNGAETELDAYNIAEGDNPSPATNNNPDLESIEFGADFASNDAAYMRLKSSTENDRLITFEDDLTGGDETLAQKYTQ